MKKKKKKQKKKINHEQVNMCQIVCIYKYLSVRDSKIQLFQEHDVCIKKRRKSVFHETVNIYVRLTMSKYFDGRDSKNNHFKNTYVNMATSLDKNKSF